jgi:pyruvate dehydrogenase (quinone)/pyruvate oxidase
MEAWRALLRRRVDRDDVPMKPQLLAGTLSDLVADDAIISTDSGTITIWAARHLQVRRRQMFSCSGHLATVAPGLPYAIAAQIAFPGRQSVAFVGDGGFTMLMGEFATAVKYGLPIKVVVVKNHLLDLIKWEQPGTLANPAYGLALEPIDFVKFAEACGGVGFRCERPDEARPALEAMLLADGPALCEAVVDPFEPPVRPSAVAPSFHVADLLLGGEPNPARSASRPLGHKIHDLTSHDK